MKKNEIMVFTVIVVLFSMFAIYSMYKTKIKEIGFLENVKTSLFCTKEGRSIDASNMPYTCCPGLQPLSGMPDGYDGDCSSLEPPTGLQVCGKCGDGVCNNTYEGKCNCPTDCANSKCGKEGEVLGGSIDRCCQGLSPQSLDDGGFTSTGGLFECAK